MSSPLLGVIDYGSGNLRSVCKALEASGASPRLITSASEMSGLDAIIVPLGGGGLISGIALAAKALKPSIRIIGAEPELAGDAAASKREGSIQPAMKPLTIADGLRTSLGERNLPCVSGRQPRALSWRVVNLLLTASKSRKPPAPMRVHTAAVARIKE